MRWRGRRQSSNISDRRGAGGKIAGGGIGFFIVAIIVALLGGDPSYFFAEGVERTVQSSQFSQKIPDDQQDELADFVSVVLAETEDTWNAKFAEGDMMYREPTLVLFNGVVDSHCGRAQSAMGPFYCPLDQTVYIDLNFFYDLKNRHDAPGDFAQAYVIAHEVGHHVQNLTGVLEKTHQAQRSLPKAEANEVSVRTELMADCLAGVWAHSVNNRNLLEDGDIQEALNAASQIGDDILQEQAQGYVVPDSFTHGSSDQRRRWFDRGFSNGQPEDCNSFEAGAL